MNKQCELAEKPCTGCGECDICDLDSSKICDNCCKCIDTGSEDYKKIEAVFLSEAGKKA